MINEMSQYLVSYEIRHLSVFYLLV
jgi:hypothetical protein